MSTSVPAQRKNAKSAPPAVSPATHDFSWLRKRINELLDQSFDEPFGQLDLSRWENEFQFAPSIDVNEKKDAYEVRAELPGVKKEDVDVTLQGNNLVIRGEKRAESTEEKEGYRHSECSFGSFYRSIPLAGQIDEKTIKAEFKDGVLRINIPKSGEARERAKKIPLT